MDKYTFVYISSSRRKMAKQQVIDKRVLGVTGTLYKNEDKQYMIRVETKDDVKDYNLVENFLNEMEGFVITISSEMEE